MLDSKVKTRWVEALKSGKYKKGTGALRESNKYCCLGVLADIEGLLVTEEYSSATTGKKKLQHFVLGWNGHKNSNLLPGYVAAKYDLHLEEGDTAGTVQEQLAYINDNSRGFSKVIEYIEKNL